MSLALRVHSPGPLNDPIKRVDAEQRMRVVVCGEPGAGKSNVINTLFGCEAIPCRSMSQQPYAVVVRHAPGEPRFALRHEDDSITNLEELDESSRLESVSFCEISVDAPHMAGIDVIEVPYLFSGEHGKELLAIVDQADLLIWVTIASQAWRLSERNVVSRLPNLPRERKVLALSRSDKLRTAADRIRIVERIETETRQIFAQNVLVSSLRLKNAQEQVTQEVWQESGGITLVNFLAEARTALATRSISLHPDEAPSVTNLSTYPDHLHDYEDEGASHPGQEENSTFCNASFLRAQGTPRVAPVEAAAPFGDDAASILFAVYGFEMAIIFNSLTGRAEYQLENNKVSVPSIVLDTGAVWEALRTQFVLGGQAKDFVESAVMTEEHILFATHLSENRLIYMSLQRDHTNLPIVRGAIQRVLRVLEAN